MVGKDLYIDGGLVCGISRYYTGCTFKGFQFEISKLGELLQMDENEIVRCYYNGEHLQFNTSFNVEVTYMPHARRVLIFAVNYALTVLHLDFNNEITIDYC